MWISLADVADHFLVFGWTDLEKKKQKDPSGISAFIVERAFKGFSSGKPWQDKIFALRVVANPQPLV